MVEWLKSRARHMRRNIIGTWRQLYIDAIPDHHNTTFLAGSGRGGTTWIAELINYDNEFRFMFEPFFARHVPQVRAFHNRQYIAPDNNDPMYLEPARLVLTGELRNTWVDAFNQRVIVDKRLIKDIRANMFLKWMDVHFPGMPIVLLLRHPMAVASSRVHHAWIFELDDFLTQERLMADFLEPHRRLIETVKDPFEKHVLQWCIENWIPLRQFKRGEIHLAFYENFSIDTRGEIGRLFAFLNKPFNERVFERVERPSRMTWARPGADKPQKSDPEGWRAHVSADQIKKAREIIARFGMDEIYGERSVPKPEAAYALMQPAVLEVGLKTQA